MRLGSGAVRRQKTGKENGAIGGIVLSRGLSGTGMLVYFAKTGAGSDCSDIDHIRH